MKYGTINVLYRTGEKEHFTIPIVDEYESEEQSETGEVYTLDDLYSEVATAFELGSEGSLHLPSDSGSFVWINITHVLSIKVRPPRDV